MRLAEILQRGLALHERDGDCACPMCGGGRLDGAWRASAAGEVVRLQAAAAEATAAHAAAREVLAGAARAMDPEPPSLARAAEVGLDASGAIAAWSGWLDGRTITDHRAMAEHIESWGPRLHAALAELRRAAEVERERREDLWRPAARDLREWLATARPAVEGAVPVANLKAAEAWVKAATDAIRDDRFAPISAAAAEHWGALRQGSSVTLESMELAGSATQRRVDIAVAIDGSDGAALGVMSQGELCSLALCTFLPRATHEESPFRFVVIDDPVQSMDPAKVEGLARVLQSVAADRQVVVFTHDDRLPEAVRRLRIPARIIEVARRTGSEVLLSPGLDPVEARLDDARAAARDSNLPTAVAVRVVPGLCRQAIEAGCAEAIRRRRLGRGKGHAAVEELLGKVTGLYEWVSLALFDDGGKESQGKVLSRLNNDGAFGPQTADAFRDCNAGAHAAYAGSLADLVRDAGHLARNLAARA